MLPSARMELLATSRTHTHWCSIWKLRCPLNQSLKKDCSTLQVAASYAGSGAKEHRALSPSVRPSLPCGLSPHPHVIPWAQVLSPPGFPRRSLLTALPPVLV